MPSPSRRALLCALASLPLSACLGSDRPGTQTTSPTTDGTTADPATATTATPSEPAVREPGEAYETADGLAVTVSDVVVRHGIVRFGTVHADPYWASGAQFLVATVAVDGDADPAELAVTATADTLNGRPDRHLAYVPGTPDTDQRLGFAVPTEPAPGEAAVVWHGPREVRWPVPGDLVADLGHAPDFSVERFEVSEPAPDPEHVAVTLKVSNTGERDGRFLAELGDAALSDQPAVTVTVPAGETATATRSVRVPAGADEVTVELRWEDGEVSRDVERA